MVRLATVSQPSGTATRPRGEGGPPRPGCARQHCHLRRVVLVGGVECPAVAQSWQYSTMTAQCGHTGSFGSAVIAAAGGHPVRSAPHWALTLHRHFGQIWSGSWGWPVSALAPLKGRRSGLNVMPHSARTSPTATPVPRCVPLSA